MRPSAPNEQRTSTARVSSAYSVQSCARCREEARARAASPSAEPRTHGPQGAWRVHRDRDSRQEDAPRGAPGLGPRSSRSRDGPAGGGRRLGARCARREFAGSVCVWAGFAIGRPRIRRLRRAGDALGRTLAGARRGWVQRHGRPWYVRRSWLGTGRRCAPADRRVLLATNRRGADLAHSERGTC